MNGDCELRVSSKAVAFACFGVLVLLFNCRSIAAAGSAPSVLVRDKGAEEVVSKLLTKLLTDQNILGLSRYRPSLLSEGVCSSAREGDWVHMMKTDEAPAGAFYQSNDPGQSSADLLRLVSDASEGYKPMSRYAVAVWKAKSVNGSSQYWIGVILSKSAISNWAGSHLGADTPGEMFSPNADAEKDVARECRHR